MERLLQLKHSLGVTVGHTSFTLLSSSASECKSRYVTSSYRKHIHPLQGRHIQKCGLEHELIQHNKTYGLIAVQCLTYFLGESWLVQVYLAVRPLDHAFESDVPVAYINRMCFYS